MKGIITGDLINSRSMVAKEWIGELEGVLNQYGTSPKEWEIFRGDSFQLEVEPEKLVKAAIAIKAHAKLFDSLDVRMGLGIGVKDYQSERITTSNGTAFINSGECFDSLKRKTLGIKTPWTAFDEKMNLFFDLASLTMDNWTPTSAKTIVELIENPKLNQVSLAKKMNKSQSNISAALSRAGFKEVINLERYFRKEVKAIIEN